MFTLNDLFRWRADLHPTAIALVDDRDDQATYGELHDRSLRCAARWQARGVTKGDVVALLDTNSVAYLVQMLGLSRIGAIPALMNWRLTATENEGVFDLIRPRAVVANPALINRLPAQLPDLLVSLHEEKALSSTDAAGSLHRTSTVWEVEDETKAPDIELPLSPLATDTFALAFSSGTTGLPKGIPWRHESLARAAMVDGAGIAGMSLGDRHLLVAPMFHLAGFSNGLMGLARGSEVHLRTSFNPEGMLDDIEALAINYMTVVPAMFRALVQTAKQRPFPPDTSSMLEMTYGASPIAPDLVREVQELFPNTGLRQFYGMTEVAGALTSLTPADHLDSEHSQSAGRVTPGFEVRLVDRAGDQVPDGMPGQIMVRSTAIMTGYWENPDATAEVMIDGWFATGDIATRKEGYLTMMDRAKDMIVTGGENVYPAEVEAVLYAHPDIRDAAVIGVPDDAFGERVHAVVVGDADLELEAVQTFCRQQLAGYKLPRSLTLVAELPRNATGKILKRDLRAPFWEGHKHKV